MKRLEETRPFYTVMDDSGRTILVRALERLGIKRRPFEAFFVEFLTFFASKFPQKLAVLLNQEEANENSMRSQNHINHLVRLVKGKCASVFSYLNNVTILRRDGNDNTVQANRPINIELPNIKPLIKPKLERTKLNL